MRVTGWLRARLSGARALRQERGASAVEFALIASLLLLILFGAIQFGIAYNRVQGLNSAGREGARSASIGASEPDIVTRVTLAQSLFLTTDVRLSVDYSVDNGTNWTNVCNDPDTGSRDCTDATSHPCDIATQGNLVRVTARVPKSQKYAIAIPLWTNWQITYSGVGTFRCEA